MVVTTSGIALQNPQVIIMSNEGSEPYIVDVDLGPNGGKVRWRSTNDAMQWIKCERSHWSWLSQYNGQPSYQAIIPSFDQLERMANNWAENPGVAIDAVTLLKQKYINDRVPHSTSFSGQFFADLGKTNPQGARSGLDVWFHGQLSGGFHSDVFRGWLRAAIFEDGLPDGTKIHEQTKDAVLAAWNEEFERRRGDVDRSVETVKRQSDAIDQKVIDFHQQIEKAKEEHQGLKKSHQLEMEDIRKKFSDDLAVRSAVDYWTERHSKLLDSTRRWGRTAIKSGAATVALLLLVAFSTVGGRSADVTEWIKTGAIQGDAISAALTGDWIVSASRLAILTLFAVWAMRIVVRNYLSYSHLAADAQERVVLIQTYLALLNDPELKDKADLKDQLLPPLLQNIFRHASDGIVKDDAMPAQTVFEALQSRIGGKSH